MRAASRCWSTARRPCRTCSVDVQELDCDFYAFSGHKLFGPTGIGVLYGKPRCSKAMPPYQGGGDMIRSVTFEKTTYNDIAVQIRGGNAEYRGRDRSRGGAFDYVSGIGMDNIAAHEHELLLYATETLSRIRRPADHRHGERKSRGDLVRARRHSSA